MPVTEVDVIVSGPVEIEISNDSTTVEIINEQVAVVEVEATQSESNLWVSDEYPGFTTPGLWVQLNPNGEEDTVTLNVVYDDGT